MSDEPSAEDEQARQEEAKRQQRLRRAAGAAGGHKRAAFYTHDELSAMSAQANRMHWERVVLAKRPDVADRPGELARMAEQAMRTHMKTIGAKSQEARRKRRK